MNDTEFFSKLTRLVELATEEGEISDAINNIRVELYSAHRESRKEIEELRGMVDDLEGQVKSLDRIIDRMNKDGSRFATAFHFRNREVDALREMLSAQQEIIDVLTDERNEWRAEVDSMAKTIRALERTEAKHD